MLLRAMFLLAAIAVLVETLLHGAAALARAALQQQELGATRAAFAAAIAAAQNTAASQGVPTPFATCYLSGASGCAIGATATVSTPTPGAAATPSACPDTACTVYLQNNTAVAESRVTYHVVATVTAANGDALVTRAGDIAFRTFETPPYASLVGTLDATLDALENGGVGDDGGNANAAGTLIDVEYVRSGVPSTPIPGNVWRALDEHPALGLPAWDR